MRHSPNLLRSRYRYQELEPVTGTPGRCRIDARIALGAPGDERVETPTSSAELCERAAICCAAYVEAMGGAAIGMDAEQACAPVREAGSSGDEGADQCHAATNMWRHSLTAMGRPIPPACER